MAKARNGAVIAGMIAAAAIALPQTLYLSKEYIRLGGRVIAIESPGSTQAVAGPILVQPDESAVSATPAQGQTTLPGGFTVSAPAGMTWTATPQQSWIGVQSQSATAVAFSVAENHSWDTARSAALTVRNAANTASSDHVVTQWPKGFSDVVSTLMPYTVTGSTGSFTLRVSGIPPNERLDTMYVRIGPEENECFFAVRLLGTPSVALYHTRWGAHVYGDIGAATVLNTTKCSMNLAASTYSVSGGVARFTTSMTMNPAMGTGVKEMLVNAITEVDPANNVVEPRWRTYAPGYWDLGSGNTFQPIRVNCAGSQVTDSLGRVWAADTNQSGAEWGMPDPIGEAPNDAAIYQTKRFMEGTWGPLNYTFTVPASNSYAVTLKFAELSFETMGQRLFHVDINGTRVLTNFDVYKEAGGRRRAVDKTFAVTLGAGQTQIQITFTAAPTSFNETHSATINAIEILQATPAGNPVMSPANPNVSYSGTQVFAITPVEPVSWEVVDPVEQNRSLGTITSGGSYTAPASAPAGSPQAIILAKATAYPARKGSNLVNLTAGGGGTFPTKRVNVGGPQLTDGSGQVWEADPTSQQGTNVWTNNGAISDAAAGLGALYQTKRYIETWLGNPQGIMTYQFTALASRTYRVTLKFAELTGVVTGGRQFHVDLNGTRVLTNFDVYKEAGGPRRAVDKTFPVTLGAGQTQITINLTAVTSSATLNGIEIAEGTPAANLAMSPSGPTVNFGATQAFSVSPSEGVTWEVVDPTGAGRSLGSITAGGSYTAPASATSPPQAIVLARASGNAARKASALVNLASGGTTAYSASLNGTARLKANLTGDNRYLRTEWRMELRMHNFTFADGKVVLDAGELGAYFYLSGSTPLFRIGGWGNECRYDISGLTDLVLRVQRTAQGVMSVELWQVNGATLTPISNPSANNPFCWPTPFLTLSGANDFRVADFTLGGTAWGTQIVNGRFAYLRMYETAVSVGTLPQLNVESGTAKVLDYEFDGATAAQRLQDAGPGARHFVVDPGSGSVSWEVTQ